MASFMKIVDLSGKSALRGRSDRSRLDQPSSDGRFLWKTIAGHGSRVPVLYRACNLTYCPVQIVEDILISRFGAIPNLVFKLVTLRCHYFSPVEASLYNRIVSKHRDKLNTSKVYTTDDLIVSTGQIRALFKFLNVSYTIFNSDPTKYLYKFGLVEIQVCPNRPDMFIRVPYVSKPYTNESSNTGLFVPLGVIEIDIAFKPTSKSIRISDWDITYLKMLAIYGDCPIGILELINKNRPLVLLNSIYYALNELQISYRQYNKLSPQESCFELARRLRGN